MLKSNAPKIAFFFRVRFENSIDLFWYFLSIMKIVKNSETRYTLLQNQVKPQVLNLCDDNIEISSIA